MKIIELLLYVDHLIALAGFCLCVGAVVWWGFGSQVFGCVWHFLRPFAFSGSVPRTAYDFLVVGWKAERRGKWAEALVAYDLALEVEPSNCDARQRREALLAAHPELNQRGVRTDEPEA